MTNTDPPIPYDSSLQPLQSQNISGPALQFKLTRDALLALFPPGSNVYIALQTIAYERVAERFIKLAKQRFEPEKQFADFMAGIRDQVRRDLQTDATFPEPAKRIIERIVTDILKQHAQKSIDQATQIAERHITEHLNAELDRVKSELNAFIRQSARAEFISVMTEVQNSIPKPRPPTVYRSPDSYASSGPQVEEDPTNLDPKRHEL